MSRTLNLKVTAPQAEFHELTCKHPLLCGGYGSGKSVTMVNQAILDASISPHAKIALYEPDYRLMSLMLRPALEDKLAELKIPFSTNKKDNIITTKSPQFGDFILGSMHDPDKLISINVFRIHVDELDTLPKAKAQMVWRKLMGRIRQKLPDAPNAPNRMSAYTTPEGFRFVYEQWVSNNPDPQMYQMVRAPTYSNPFLPSDFVDGLKKNYPAELVDAYVEGYFVNMTSGQVYKSFDKKAHDTDVVARENETLYIGMDFNIYHMAATIYVRRDKVWYAVDEVSEAYDTKEVAGIIKERYPKSQIIIYPDASGNSDHTSATESDISILRNKPFQFECRIRGEVRGKSKGKNPRVKDRVTAFNAALEKGLIKINSSKCPRVVECLHQQVYNVNGLPDKTMGVDHQNDATTYPIAYELPIHRPIANIEVQYLI